MNHSNEIRSYVQSGDALHNDRFESPASGLDCTSSELKGLIELLAGWIADDFLYENSTLFKNDSNIQKPDGHNANI